jgi:hypothetical protein
LTKYYITSVGVDISQINDVDLVEWHRQTDDIVSQRLIQSTINVRKIEIVVTNCINNLEMKRRSIESKPIKSENWKIKFH